MLGPALQSVGNRDSLPALKPTGQSAADSPKGSRQVLADVTGHLEPFFTSFRTAAHPERLHSDQQRTSIRRLSLMHWNSVLQRQPFREELRFSSRIANRPQLDEICSTTFSTVYAHLFTCHAFTNTFNYLHVVRKQEDCIRLDCNRDAPRLNYCQLERIHARARVDMSMLATGKMAFRVESGLIVRPWFKEFGLKGRRSKRTELWNHLTMFYQLPRS